MRFNDEVWKWLYVVAAAFYATVEALYLWHASPPFDGSHYLIGRDFLNMWMGARQSLAGEPGALFDAQRYNALIHQLYAPHLAVHNWSYPPHIFLLIWPFGFMPYLVGYAVWSLAGLGAMLWVGRTGGRNDTVFLLLAPVTFIGIFTGQNGLFTGALLVGAMANWDRRPWLAGILLGLLSVKPQLVLLVPVALILTRRWRVLAAAATTAALMMGATTAIWGLGVWRDYITLALPYQSLALTHGASMMEAMMPTPYMNARLMGAPVGLATAFQAGCALVGLAAVIWTYGRRRDPLLSSTMLVTAALVVTPYAFNYDMVALTLLLAQVKGRSDSSVPDSSLVLALWLMPLAMMLLGLFHVAGSVFLLLALMVRLYQRMKDAPSPSATMMAQA